MLTSSCCLSCLSWLGLLGLLVFAEFSTACGPALLSLLGGVVDRYTNYYCPQKGYSPGRLTCLWNVLQNRKGYVRYSIASGTYGRLNGGQLD